MLRSNDCRRSKGIATPAGRAEGTPSPLEKEKEKKASADDDMLEFHRLSRKNSPSGFWGRWKKNQLLRIILRLHLHYSRGIEGIATPQKLVKGAGYSHSLSILSYIMHVRYISIY